MTELDGYAQQTIETVVANRGDDEQVAQRVRALTTQALAKSSFMLACCERIITSVEQLDGRWRNSPLFASTEPGIVVRAIFWPPGYGNDPHLHDEWSVTAVLHNEIGVDTFKGANTVEDAVSRSPIKITARAPDCGYLVPPCVHRLYNPTQRDSATLHVFAAERRRRGGPAEDRRRGGTESRLRGDGIRAGGMGRCTLVALCGVLAGITDPGAIELLERIFALGGLPVKLEVVKALASHDVRRAYQKSRQLESHLAGRDKEVLSAINARLASSLSRPRAEQVAAAVG
jgi:predicted metal-dependent enzyme (double-stranded beta helix superfamily)